MPSPWVIMDETTWKLWNNEDSLQRRPIDVNRLSKTDTTKNLIRGWRNDWPRRQPLTDSPLQLSRVWTPTLTMYIVRVACSWRCSPQASLASSGSAHYSNNRVDSLDSISSSSEEEEHEKSIISVLECRKGPQLNQSAAAIRTCEQQLEFLCKYKLLGLALFDNNHSGLATNAKRPLGNAGRLRMQSVTDNKDNTFFCMHWPDRVGVK